VNRIGSQSESVIFFGANTLNFRACSSGKSLLDAILSNGSRLRLHRGNSPAMILLRYSAPNT
jgi:hypothetical protein